MKLFKNIIVFILTILIVLTIAVLIGYLTGNKNIQHSIALFGGMLQGFWFFDYVDRQ